MTSRRALAPLLALAWLGLVLAACGFPEGPDWPAPSTGDALVPRGVEWASDPDPNQAERRDLSALAAGGAAVAPGRSAAQLVGVVRPLMVIRFADRAADFEPALYDTLRRALEIRPATAFDVVAVAPELGGLDETILLRDVNSVVRALAEMGLPDERISLSATTSSGIEVHEVHFYVR